MLFSIITICLNNKEGLEKTGNSIMGQTCTDFQWIIIDGASNDGTLDYLSKIQDDKIHWLSEPDKGLYDAMNKGLEEATADYVLFLNAGDVLASTDILEKLKAEIESANLPDFIYGDCYEQSNAGELLLKKARSAKWIWYGMFTHHQAMIYRLGAVDSLRYKMKYPIGADYAFTAEVLKRTNNTLCVAFPISIFEQGGLSSSNTAQGAKDQWNIRRDILGIGILVRVLIRAVQFTSYLIRGIFPTIYKKMRFS